MSTATSTWELRRGSKKAIEELRIGIKVWSNPVVLALALALTWNCAGQSARERGATAFGEKGCVQCHTIGGIGGKKGPDLSGVGRRLNKDALQRQILEGGRAMPAFREALTDDEVKVLVRYLQHCRAKTSGAVSAGRSGGERLVMY